LLWTPDSDRVLIQKVGKNASRWGPIAARLASQNEADVKDRWGFLHRHGPGELKPQYGDHPQPPQPLADRPWFPSLVNHPVAAHIFPKALCGSLTLAASETGDIGGADVFHDLSCGRVEEVEDEKTA
jgi:hypothetical protein